MQANYGLLWAPQDYPQDLETELTRKKIKIIERRRALFVIECERALKDLNLVFAESQAEGAELVHFSTNKEACDLLTRKAPLWIDHPMSHFRKNELIATKTRTLRKKKMEWKQPIEFEQSSLPGGPLGVFCLNSEKTMWVSTSIFPAVRPWGFDFLEQNSFPSRAHTKLWELFMRTGFMPKQGETCLELGSAPGGWTRVLAELGCTVFAVDKGEMDPSVLTLDLVHWIRKDAFKIRPGDFPKIDWFFSDLICYPKDLLEIQRAFAAAGVKKFVCTIKFKATTDFEALEEFLRQPGSRALHLQANKHEVTWFYQNPS